jgi:hypothetical protein
MNWTKLLEMTVVYGKILKIIIIFAPLFLFSLEFCYFRKEERNR